MSRYCMKGGFIKWKKWKHIQTKPKKMNFWILLFIVGVTGYNGFDGFVFFQKTNK